MVQKGYLKFISGGVGCNEVLRLSSYAFLFHAFLPRLSLHAFLHPNFAKSTLRSLPGCFLTYCLAFVDDFSI